MKESDFFNDYSGTVRNISHVDDANIGLAQLLFNLEPFQKKGEVFKI